MNNQPLNKNAVFLFLSVLVIPAIALLLVATKTYAANGLTGSWSLDEGSGTVAPDSSGNGINGTIVRGTGTGSPAWVSPGHDVDFPYALDFDGSGTPGSATNTVNLGNDARLDQLDNYTISLWVKFKPGYVGGGTWANLVGRNAGAGNWAWMIYVNSAGTIRPHHRNSNGSFAPLTNSATVMPVGEWVHIEQVADGGKLHLYINGQEDPNFPVSYSGTTMSLPTANTYIGQDTREYAPRAIISDVKIYNDAPLTPQVTTGPATNVTQTAARLNATLSTLGDFTSANVFFRYRIAGSGDPYIETTPQAITAAGPFSANISGLTANTQYEFTPVVRWQGRNGIQEITGDLFTFATLAYTVNIQVADNLTGEDGDTGSFRVCLNAQPSAPVTITLSSSNNDEGTVPASITIQPADWNNCNANIVTVTGVNDSPPVGDGSVPYTIITGDVTSADANFNALAGTDVEDVAMENQNDDPPGIVMSVVNNDSSTSENGDIVRVRFRLLSLPSANVTIPLSLDDTTEGSLGGVTSITITPANWDQPQNNEVLITGVNDALTDGDVPYSLITGDPASGDTGYNVLVGGSVADVQLLSIDNDAPGATIIQTGGSTDITEGGATDTFTVVLNSQPATGNTVIVTIQPGAQIDLGSGPDVAVQLTFNNSNWNVPQTVNVEAKDDILIEGDHTGLITTSIDSSTTETSYLTVDPADVAVQIIDNDDDNDGIPAAVEDAGPNGGDANNDGTPDSLQPHVAAFANDITNDYSVLEVDDTCQINAADSIRETSQTEEDPAFQYPYGLISFTIDCGTPGFTTAVQEYYYGASDNNFILRKYNPAATMYFTVEAATLAQQTIGGKTLIKATFSITDGGELDTDGAMDGVIIDPAGLALAESADSGLTDTGQGTAFYILVAVLLVVLGVGCFSSYKARTRTQVS